MDFDLEAMEASSVGRPCCAVWESHADRETGCEKPCTGKGKNARHFTGLGAQATLMAALFFSRVSLACAFFSFFFCSFYWPVCLVGATGAGDPRGRPAINSYTDEDSAALDR